MKSIILEICRSYQNANILLKMLSVLHTLYRYTVLLSLVAHAGMVVTCIALQKKKTTTKNNQKTPPPHNELWVMSFLLVMTAPFIDGMKEERKLLSLYNFISLGISFNYLY